MSDSAHPLLPPATPVLHCPDGSVQVGGVDTADGVILPPGAGWAAALLAGLDGRRTRSAVLTDAVDAGSPREEVEQLLRGLRAAGLLLDLEAADLLATGPGPSARARTTPELAAAATAGPGPRWSGRAASSVVVEGANRVGVPVAAILAGSGVGRISVRDGGTVRAGDAIAGGLTAADEGRPRSAAAADAVRRASPLTELRPPPRGAAGAPVADLVVLARPWAASDPLAGALQQDRVPHLVATIRGETGVVGPLVVPGRTSCLRCADLHRRDADPRWPLLAAQLTAADPSPSGATTTCLFTALTAAVQVLAYLDGTAAPATLGATLELRPPDPTPRLRAWPVHPSCGCLDSTLDRPHEVSPAAQTVPEVRPPGSPTATRVTMAR